MVKMIDPADGTRLPCHWADCWRPGDTRYQAVVREVTQPHRDPVTFFPVPGEVRRIHFLFCCERHRDYWRNGHLAFGMLPAGSRSLPAPP